MIKKNISGFKERLKDIIHFIRVDIWRISLNDLSRGKTFLVTQLRILILTIRGLGEDKVLLRAPALTFYSIFIVVPALALAFSVARGFGLEVYLVHQLQIALEGREEVLNWALELTESFLNQLQLHGGALAAAGLGLLLSSLLMLLANMENSFNEIWQVDRSRPLSRKLSDYLAIIIVAPVFLVLSSAVTVFLNTAIREIEIIFLSPLLLFLVRLAPFLLIWIVLTLLYIIMPNTYVKFSSALVAAVIAGTILQLIQWGYISLQVGAATYSTMYGSFAAFPLLLLWMQASWLAVLFGAELSFANQNIEAYRLEKEIKDISPLNKKILTLYIMHLLVINFQNGSEPFTPEKISKTLQIPGSLVRNILGELEKAGLINATQTGRPRESAYQPAQDIQTLSIKTILEKLDYKGRDVLIAKPAPALEEIKDTLKEFYNLLEKSEQNKLLKDL